jgi:hypothetical protein
LNLAHYQENQKDIYEGRTVSRLSDWSLIVKGYHIYFPNRIAILG